MRCSFCNTDGHPHLRVVIVPNMVRVSPSKTSDRAPNRNTAGACDACLDMIESLKESLDTASQRG